MTASVRDDWRVVVAIVSGGHFFSHFYMLALPPLFPLFDEEFGLTNTELGLAVSVLAIGGLLQAPIGKLVDRVGAKRVFVAGVGVAGSGIALIGVGPHYPAMLLFAAVAGLGLSVFHPADYALIDTVTGRTVRGRAFSVHTFSGYAGFAAAPVVVGSLASVSGWRTTLSVVGGAGLLYAVFAAVFLAPAYRGSADDTDAGSRGDSAEGGSFLSAMRQPGLPAMAGFFLVTAFASKGIQSFTSVLAVDSFALNESLGNTLLTTFFAFGAVGVLTGGFLADRYPPGRVILVTLAAGSIVLFATVGGVVPKAVPVLVSVFGVIGFFYTLITPARDRLVSERSASASVGQSFGLVFTGATVGALSGPVVLGAVGDAASMVAAFVLIGVLYLLAGALAFSLDRGWLANHRAPAPLEGD